MLTQLDKMKILKVIFVGVVFCFTPVLAERLVYGKNTSDVQSLGELSSISGSVDSIIGQISEITGIFDGMTGGLLGGGGLSGNNNMLQCIAGGIDLGDMSKLTDGLCSLDGLNIGGSFDIGGIAQCTGVEIPSINNVLNGLCNNSSGSGATGGIDIPTSGGDYLTGGEYQGDVGELNPDGKTNDSATITVANSVDTEGVTDGTNGNKPKKVQDRRYPSGKTGDDLWHKDGGYFNKRILETPSSSDAKAALDMDIPTLMLKSSAIKNIGNSHEYSMGLAETPAESMNKEDEVAQFLTSANTDYHAFSDSLAITLRAKFSTIDKDSLAKYYQEEKKKFEESIRDDHNVQSLYNLSAKGVQAEYADILFQESQKENFIFDTSEARVKYLAPESKNPYRFAALHQTIRNTLIKARMGREMKRRKILLDIAVQRAYVSASIFRDDIAMKEIDKMLKAVDQAIR